MRRRWWLLCLLSVGISGAANTCTTVQPHTPPDTALPGVIIRPGDNVQAIVDGHPEGTTFQLSAGTYLNQGIIPKSGDVFLGMRAAILDGTNTTPYAFRGNGQTGIRIDGLVIQNYNSPLQDGAIQTDNTGSSSWVISNNELRDNAAYGIRAGGNGNQLLGNYVHHNGQAGLGAHPGSDILVQDNEIAFNNTRNIDQYWEAGGTKFTATNGLVLRNNSVHDNKGPGLWTDGDNVNALIEGNSITDNEGPGIYHEISYAAVIRNNTLMGNGGVQVELGWLWGSQIMISTSQDVDVYGNTVLGSGRANGIGVVQQDRGAGVLGTYAGFPVSVHHNDITMQAVGPSHGRTGASQDYDPADTFFRRVTFDYNVYRIASSGERYWDWGGLRSWEEFRADGQEEHGRIE